MSEVVSLQPDLYVAKSFSVDTEVGKFAASGTLCGHIDFVVPLWKTIPLSPDETLSLIAVLQNARADVLRNARPLSDPRLIG